MSKYNRQGLIDCEIVSLNETISDSKRKLIKVIDIFGNDTMKVIEVNT